MNGQMFKLDPTIFLGNLPKETPSRVLAQSIGAQLDAEVRKAINNHLGREDWGFNEVSTRLALCTYPDSDLQTVTMDGEPIFSLLPAELNIEERDLSTFVCATYRYKILNEKPARMPGDPEGYDVVSAKGDFTPCFTCALYDLTDLCADAKCLPDSRPDGMEIKFVKREGGQ